MEKFQNKKGDKLPLAEIIENHRIISVTISFFKKETKKFNGIFSFLNFLKLTKVSEQEIFIEVKKGEEIRIESERTKADANKNQKEITKEALTLHLTLLKESFYNIVGEYREYSGQFIRGTDNLMNVNDQLQKSYIFLYNKGIGVKYLKSIDWK